MTALQRIGYGNLQHNANPLRAPQACNLCGVAGHWTRECPMAVENGGPGGKGKGAGKGQGGGKGAVWGKGGGWAKGGGWKGKGGKE